MPAAVPATTVSARSVLAPHGREVPSQWIRPLAARHVRGLAHVGDELLVLDARTGRVAVVDPRTDDTRVVNDGAAEGFVRARGLAAAVGAVWFATDEGIRRAAWRPGAALDTGELILPGAAEAVAVAADRVYVVAGSQLHEHVLDGDHPDATPLRSIDLHGVGAKGIAATSAHLWICDRVEQTVYCLDRATLGTRFTVITPMEAPTAIGARDPRPGEPADADIVHIAYYEDEPFVKDIPWMTPEWQVRYRDRVVVHQLHVHHDPAARAAWSSGHRLQIHYYVDVEPDDDAPTLRDVQWRMSLPLDTPRQRLVEVEPIGLPFQVVDEPDSLGAPQRVAVFTIPRIDAGTRLVLGWRATLEVFGIKHQISSDDLVGMPLGSHALDPVLAEHYLGDDGDLDLDTPVVAEATSTAVGDEANPWLAAHRIRTWVYDRLEYEMGYSDSPVGVLARGTGSCGEYVGTIMALLRRAGIACRVAGRYKCPYVPWSGGPLYPDYNHVWIDMYLPGWGWFPVESNPDDVVDGGPYPDRFFLGLPWRHVEVGKDISFEKVLGTTESGRRRRVGARRLSRNHIRFDLLAELAPVAGPA